ncbi:unnamed protein product [Clonostachys rosea f. rosea IK726]|uniref:Uncharacterized protein n=2 Tax=Bionectria ochroleuca TaxID=29856 RepID=A0A0B7KLL8_BIOOC|nr:unnamed protein product [Clonostachys rosea f. rosea IK726]
MPAECTFSILKTIFICDEGTVGGGHPQKRDQEGIDRLWTTDCFCNVDMNAGETFRSGDI